MLLPSLFVQGFFSASLDNRLTLRACVAQRLQSENCKSTAVHIYHGDTECLNVIVIKGIGEHEGDE